MQTYLFYDLETTGLNRAFDQPLQFAAIRTDRQLVELERYDLAICLRPDVVPSPKAVLTHRLGPDTAARGRCEYEAAIQIHALFNRPGTISVGYNSLRFDDECLRFVFYRNLLAPYTHQYQNGCGRMDLLTFAAVYRLFKPCGLEWPTRDGRPSLRLEDLNAANRLSPGRPHAAMADVEALLALARRLKSETETWDYLCRRFDKSADQGQVHQLPLALGRSDGDHRLALLVSSEFGASGDHMAPALGLGPSEPYPNQRLYLRLDHPDLARASVDDVAATTWVVRKKFGEPPLALPPLPRYWQRLDAPRRQLAEANLQRLQSDHDLTAAVTAYHRAYRYPEVPAVDADAALYLHGFWGDADQRRFEAFHRAGADERFKHVSTFATPLARTLAMRLLFRNFPEPYPEAVVRARDAYLTCINPATPELAPVDHRGRARRTPVSARGQIADLLGGTDLTSSDRQLLKSLDAFIDTRFAPPSRARTGPAPPGGPCDHG